MTFEAMKENLINKFGADHPAVQYFLGVYEEDDDFLLTEISYEFAINWKED